MKKLTLLLLLFSAADVHASKVVQRTMGGDLSLDAAPEGAVLRTMGGDIRMRSASGTVVAKTMGGSIHVNRLDGSLDAGTMGGDVIVEVIGTGSGRLFEVTSMGGQIEVTLPRDFSGEFEIELEQDDDGPKHEIVSDFPLQVRETKKHRWFRGASTVLNATGRSGSGANRVRLRTIGGDIRIRRK
jgi:DUF4097 and DUF4098 domain-containing protein YvlB